MLPVAVFSEDAGGGGGAGAAAGSPQSEEAEPVEPADDAAASTDPLPKKLRFICVIH
jgi:hypothetical protein